MYPLLSLREAELGQVWGEQLPTEKKKIEKKKRNREEENGEKTRMARRKNKRDSGGEKIWGRRSGQKDGLVESTQTAPILSHISLNEVAKFWP